VYKRQTNNYPGEFIFTPVLLAEIDGNLKEFKSNAEFLNLFGDKKAEIKKFMRQNRIKFKKQMPEALIPVFAYFDSITHPSPAKL
jgi:hypothetical protein